MVLGRDVSLEKNVGQIDNLPAILEHEDEISTNLCTLKCLTL